MKYDIFRLWDKSAYYSMLIYQINLERSKILKRTYYIEQIKKTGLRIGFIAEKLGVHQSTLSHFLHGSKKTSLKTDDVLKLDALLERYL